MGNTFSPVPAKSIFSLPKEVNVLLQIHLFNAVHTNPLTEVGGTILARKQNPIPEHVFYEIFAFSHLTGEDEKSLGYFVGCIDPSLKGFKLMSRPSSTDIFYLGEWHTHFNNPGISKKDEKYFNEYPYGVLFIVHDSGIFIAQQFKSKQIYQVLVPFNKSLLISKVQ